MSAIIDVHTHIFDEKTYWDYLKKAGGKLKHAITIQYWTHEGPPRYNLDALFDFADEDKILSVIATVNILHPIERQLQDLKERERWSPNIVGVKMYPGYQHFYPFDELVNPVAEFCIEYKKPLMFHSGVTSQRGKPLLKYARPEHIDELATRFPDLKIIIAHMGCPWFRDAAAVMAKHKHVYADISGTIDKVPPEKHELLVRRYIRELSEYVELFPEIIPKIMFGTDYSGEGTHLDQVEAYKEVVNNVFAPHERDYVYYETAQKLFFPNLAP